jgi:uncharacterized protein (TIGR02145 family)
MILTHGANSLARGGGGQVNPDGSLKCLYIKNLSTSNDFVIQNLSIYNCDKFVMTYREGTGRGKFGITKTGYEEPFLAVNDYYYFDMTNGYGSWGGSPSPEFASSSEIITFTMKYDANNTGSGTSPVSQTINGVDYNSLWGPAASWGYDKIECDSIHFFKGRSSYTSGSFEIYEFKVYDDTTDTLKYDFTPAMKNGRAGFYESVNNIFYEEPYNDGTIVAYDEASFGGRAYKAVHMPDGKLWLAENLDYKFSGCVIGSSSSDTDPRGNYYNDDEATYGIDGTYQCGLLYNWPAVMALEDNKSALIPGWHVPTDDEWTALGTAIGGVNNAGTKLKALDGIIGGSWPSGWNGTDNYGAKILPSGRRTSSYANFGSYSWFWTATAYDSSNARLLELRTNAPLRSDYMSKGYQVSVRLVHD